MNLTDLANHICEQCGMNDTDDVAAAKQFLQRRLEMIWNTQLWRSSLIEATLTLNPDGTSTLGNTVWIPGRATLLLPPEFESVIAVRADNHAMNVASLESYYRTDTDWLDMQGDPTEFQVLRPAVWEFSNPTPVCVTAKNAQDGAVALKVVASTDGISSLSSTLQPSPNALGNYIGNVLQIFSVSKGVTQDVLDLHYLVFSSAPKFAFAPLSPGNVSGIPVFMNGYYANITLNGGGASSDAFPILISQGGAPVELSFGTFFQPFNPANPTAWGLDSFVFIQGYQNSNPNAPMVLAPFGVPPSANTIAIDATEGIPTGGFPPVEPVSFTDAVTVIPAATTGIIVDLSNYTSGSMRNGYVSGANPFIFISNVSIGTIPATAGALPVRQRIRLTTQPQVATNLRILGKTACPVLGDYDTMPINNVEPCLMAFARGDLLLRARQNGKAQLASQEGATLLAQLARSEAFQAANNFRITPDNGFGGDNVISQPNSLHPL